jgi:tetratricopeptide (TPR) repeat protein
MSEFPLCRGRYYGVDYAGRGRRGVAAGETPGQFVPPGHYAANDLSWYANIPVPTSYMAMGTTGKFFGGYDHRVQAGLVHVANPHISPGKKQWTWGNHAFGYAWDRNLTDPDGRNEYGPYIELMAGVYTDNQPDFSFLMPGETKTWSQFWYPIRKIGPAQEANVNAAVSLLVKEQRLRVGVSVTRNFPGAVTRLSRRGRLLQEWKKELSPGAPLVEEVELPRGMREADLTLVVQAKDGEEIISYAPRSAAKTKVPPPATEPLAPRAVSSNDELFIIGLHLEQYRHATRRPEDYWREALRRDPGDSRCLLALGKWHLRRGEFAVAEKHFRTAIARLISLNPNPYDGEAHYQLGLTLRFLNRDEEAYAALYKSTWNQAWRAAGYHALAELDCRRQDWPMALEHLDQALSVNTGNLRARNHRVLVLRRLGRHEDATAQLQNTRALDPLDWWARDLAGEVLTCNAQVRLDVSLDYARAGFLSEAVAILNGVVPEAESGAAPLLHYYRAWLLARQGKQTTSRAQLRQAAHATSDYCFPSRLEEITILEFALAANPRDARAPYYLGNLLYDRRRHGEAIRLWEKAAKLDPRFSIVWRNLGLGYFNILKNPRKAHFAYDRAFAAAPRDARVLFERDQLWKRTGEAPAKRLAELLRHQKLVRERDDLTVELSALYNQTGQHAAAQKLLATRVFQPWEGGEGQALGQHVRTHLALGRAALRDGQHGKAQAFFAAALEAPVNLGEARHLLANQSDVHFWLGEAAATAGNKMAARKHWQAAASFRGDFQEMRVRAFSEMTYYSALALERLGRGKAARRLWKELLVHARRLARSPAQIDYFATSLPTMLVFDDDLSKRQAITATFLTAQARLGLGQIAKGRRLLKSVLRRDPNHPLAADLLKSLPA